MQRSFCKRVVGGSNGSGFEQFHVVLPTEVVRDLGLGKGSLVKVVVKVEC